MMKLKLFHFVIPLIICFPLFAELSATKDSEGNYSNTIFIYSNFPDYQVWEKLSYNQNRRTLNENGDANGDQKPEFGLNPITGFPEVVWSKFDGSDYEISYSYFNGSEWANHEIITNNDLNDFDPCIEFSDDGTVKVAWWSDEEIQQVYYKIRKINGEWSSNLRVSNPLERSIFPSITALNNLSFVSFESISNSNQSSISLSTIDDDPDPIPALCSRIKIGSDDFAPNSNPSSHSKNGHLWVDWIYDENFLCWSEKIYDEWIFQRYEPYSGLDDIPRARLYIKIKVLNGQ